MVLLDNDAYLAELAKLFQRSKSSGSLQMTMKRYDGKTKPTPREGRPRPPDPTEYKCLHRAQLGSRKISTVVSQKDVNRFQLAYATVLKTNIDGLKKKEKTKSNVEGQKKKSKSKSKQATKSPKSANRGDT